MYWSQPAVQGRKNPNTRAPAIGAVSFYPAFFVAWLGCATFGGGGGQGWGSPADRHWLPSSTSTFTTAGCKGRPIRRMNPVAIGVLCPRPDHCHTEPPPICTAAFASVQGTMHPPNQAHQPRQHKLPTSSTNCRHVHCACSRRFRAAPCLKLPATTAASSHTHRNHNCNIPASTSLHSGKHKPPTRNSFCRTHCHAIRKWAKGAPQRCKPHTVTRSGPSH
jgi:hypothetical protein